jgi:hypothetical protein
MAKLGPLPDVNGVVKIRLLGTSTAGVKWANVLHAKVTGSLTQATLNSCATAIRGYWLSDLGPWISNSYQLTTTEVTDLTTRTGAQGVDANTANATNAGAAMTANTAACLTLKIANRYRGGHPRLYLPGVPASASTNGLTWATGIANNYQTAGRAFWNHINSIIVGATTWQLCAVSYYRSSNGVQSYKQPPDVYIITDVVCHTRVDSMRSRLGKETS